MIVEIFRMMFGRPIPEKPGWPRFAGWVVTFAIAAAGALLLRNATAGRDYPWSQGKVYFAAMLKFEHAGAPPLQARIQSRQCAA